MNFELKHLSYNVSDLNASREFYIDKLGLELINGNEHFFAAKLGNIRFSFFPGAKKYPIADDAAGMGIILAVEDVQKAKEFITGKEVSLLNDIVEAPGFMKFFTVEDPDGNIVHFGEYLTNPLQQN